MGASNLIYLATMYGSHWNGIDSAICRISAIYRRPSQLIASPIPTLAINGSCLPYPPPAPIFPDSVARPLPVVNRSISSGSSSIYWAPFCRGWRVFWEHASKIKTQMASLRNDLWKDVAIISGWSWILGGSCLKRWP